MKIGVQLYTLRTSFDKDLWGTFDKLAGLGYKNVELAGTYGLEFDELGRGLKERGLKVTSAHVGMDQFDADLGRLVAMCESLEFDSLIVPWINAKDHGGFRGVGEKLTKHAKALSDSGLKVGYHNHAFEFEKEGDDLGYDVLWHHADPKLVFAEIDLYWVTKAHQSCEEWLAKMSGHVPFTHFKDMKKDTESYVEVGSGRMDWNSIIAACEKAGVKYAIVEHDEPEMDPIESVKISREYLLGLGLKD